MFIVSRGALVLGTISSNRRIARKTVRAANGADFFSDNLTGIIRQQRAESMFLTTCCVLFRKPRHWLYVQQP